MGVIGHAAAANFLVPTGDYYRRTLAPERGAERQRRAARRARVGHHDLHGDVMQSKQMYIEISARAPPEIFQPPTSTIRLTGSHSTRVQVPSSPTTSPKCPTPPPPKLSKTALRLRRKRKKLLASRCAPCSVPIAFTDGDRAGFRRKSCVYHHG